MGKVKGGTSLGQSSAKGGKGGKGAAGTGKGIAGSTSIPAPKIPKEVLEWFDSGRITMMQRVEDRSGGSFSSKTMDEAKVRLAALSTNQSQKGVSFAGDALHHLYYSTKFERRGLLLYSIFAQVLSAKVDTRLIECKAALSKSLCCLSGATGTALKVASVGGGPGTDVAGLVWANKHFMHWLPSQQAEPAVSCSLWDFERSWRKNLSALQEVVGAEMQLDFGGCDVRHAIHHPSNKNVLNEVGDLDLVIFSYVANETSDHARQLGWAFYKSLIVALKKGAVIILADVMKHSRRHLDLIAFEMTRALQDHYTQPPPQDHHTELNPEHLPPHTHPHNEDASSPLSSADLSPHSDSAVSCSSTMTSDSHASANPLLDQPSTAHTPTPPAPSTSKGKPAKKSAGGKSAEGVPMGSAGEGEKEGGKVGGKEGGKVAGKEGWGEGEGEKEREGRDVLRSWWLTSGDEDGGGGMGVKEGGLVIYKP